MPDRGVLWTGKRLSLSKMATCLMTQGWPRCCAPQGSPEQPFSPPGLLLNLPLALVRPRDLGQVELETVNPAAASVGQPGDASVLRWNSMCHGLSWPVRPAACTARRGQDVSCLVSQLGGLAVSKKCSLMSHLWYKLHI